MIPSVIVQSSFVNQTNLLFNSELSSLKFWHASIALRGAFLSLQLPVFLNTRIF